MIFISYAVRDSQSMRERRAHLPSPIKERILWSSPLKGMERPTRTFKSFIRNTPSKPNIEKHKPLPPTPPSFTRSTTDSSHLPSVPTSPNETPGVVSWKAPAKWSWDDPSPPNQYIKTTSLFPARTYSPLLPEPSPRIPDMQAIESSWSFDKDPSQAPLLQFAHEGSSDRPSPPPRNPSRISFLQTVSDESDSESRTRSETSQTQLHPSVGGDFISCPKYAIKQRLPTEATYTTAASTPGLSYRFSDAATKAKAFASLGIGSPRNTQNVWEGWSESDRPDSLQNDPGTHRGLSLHRKNDLPLDFEDSIVDGDADDPVLNDKLQQMSFSHDYHSVLADQYHDCHARSQSKFSRRPPPTYALETDDTSRGRLPSEEQALMPQPLALRKASDSSSLSAEHQDQRPGTASAPRPWQLHKRLASLVACPHVHRDNKRRSVVEDLQPQPINYVISSKRQQIPQSEIDQVPDWHARFPDFLSHPKSLITSKARMAASSGESASSSQHVSSNSASPRLEMSTPILRLPGGLMLVRQSPSTDQLSNTTSTLDYPPNPKSDRQKPHSDSSNMGFSVSQRPASSVYSQSPISVASGTANSKRTRRDSGPLPSPPPHSSSSSLPKSPLTQEVPLSLTPPPIRPRRPRIPQLPSPSILSSYKSNKGTDDSQSEHTIQEGSFKSGLLEKAKHVRHVWRNHHKDAKHEKLKQSIRVIGPADTRILNETAE